MCLVKNKFKITISLFGAKIQLERVLNLLTLSVLDGRSEFDYFYRKRFGSSPVKYSK